MELKKAFKEGSGSVSFIPSILVGITLGCGPIASMLVNKYGCRVVTIMGAFLASFGMAVSAAANSLLLLYLSIGICTGKSVCNALDGNAFLFKLNVGFFRLGIRSDLFTGHRLCVHVFREETGFCDGHCCLWIGFGHLYLGSFDTNIGGQFWMEDILSDYRSHFATQRDIWRSVSATSKYFH